MTTIFTNDSDNSSKVWEKGGPSPNPKGRPKGSQNKIPATMRALLAEEAGEYAITMAKELMYSGDSKIVKCVLDKLIPKLKSEVVELDLPEINSVETARVATTKLLKAVSDGEVTMQEAKEVMTLIERGAKMFQ